MAEIAVKEAKAGEGKGRRLNWQQACELLGGCSRSHFYNLVNAGEIPAQRYGKARGLWVWEEDVRGYLVRA
jgi:excisionase family DNA binding protein